ncbi:MAG: type II secretion system protein N [Pseudomonadales bacterium]|nr:type II secretion system protein N [Pseudomonadales bacterium]
MMKRFALYFGIGLLSFTGFVVAFAPAAPFWSLVENDVGNALPELKVQAIGGTVWSGNALLQYQDFPESRLRWVIDPWSLMDANAAIELNLKGEGHDLEGNATVAADSGTLRDVSGFIHSEYVNRVSEGYGLTFAGQIDISNLTVSADRRWITGAEGRLHWTGGRILYRTYLGTRVFMLPPLDGHLSREEDNLRLDLTHEQQPVLDVVLQPTGWALVRLRGRLFELARLEWPEGQSPDDIVLQVDEKLFPGRAPTP